FLWCEMHFLPPNDHPAGIEVDAQIFGLERWKLIRQRRPSKGGANAGKQLLHPKGFHDVVICTGVQCKRPHIFSAWVTVSRVAAGMPSPPSFPRRGGAGCMMANGPDGLTGEVAEGNVARLAAADSTGCGSEVSIAVTRC